MTNYCPNCGTEIPEGAAFCPTCGQGVPQEEAQHQEQRAASSETGTTQETFEPPQVQEQPVFTPPQAARSGTSKNGVTRRGQLARRLSVAMVLGVLAVLIVGTVLYLVNFSGPPAAQPDPNLPPTNEPNEPDSNPPPTNKGSLDELVQQQVGDFTLQKTSEWPKAIQAGATEALTLEYESSDGAVILHNVAAYGSPEEANRSLDASVDVLVSEEGFQKGGTEPLENDQGQQIGRVALLQNEFEGQHVELVIWTNDNLEARAGGLGKTAADFFENSEY